MLSLYRRHRAKCKMRGRRAKCFCPIWVQGKVHGLTVRRSLDITNWESAQKKVREWESHGIKNSLSLSEAYERFLTQHMANGSKPETLKKHRRLMNQAVKFLGDAPVRSISVDDVSRFRESWKLAPMTTRNTIERMRSFFKFCIARDWMEKNPASSLKLPKIVEVEPKPYEPEELIAIEKAVNEFPNWGIYKSKTRERVRAFIAVLRWTGMRIGDACQLSKDKIASGMITLRTEKNGKLVRIIMHPDIEKLLKPIENGQYYFWSGNGKVSSVVSDWERTLERLGRDLPFKLHAHKFRHTLSVELLSKGVPVSEVAAILGNSPRIVEKTYNQFIQSRQDALNRYVESIWKQPS
ncbi:MAG TPA: tyrosine-type recombinase/integrase [Acidobacteriaceae bacterium]|nr:tyrosine-type recombinase/integrase [Acidobacteriaceae bacterium]